MPWLSITLGKQRYNPVCCSPRGWYVDHVPEPFAVFLEEMRGCCSDSFQVVAHTSWSGHWCWPGALFPQVLLGALFPTLFWVWWQQVSHLSPLQQAAIHLLSSVAAQTVAAWCSVAESWWQYLLLLAGRLGMGRARVNSYVGLGDDHSSGGKGSKGKGYVMEKEKIKCLRGVTAESWPAWAE